VLRGEWARFDIYQRANRSHRRSCQIAIPARLIGMPHRPPLRHCPLCGIAMQARKSRTDIEHFDRFECLNCHTTIEAPAVGTPPKTTRPD
jgi:hypothetical protein